MQPIYPKEWIANPRLNGDLVPVDSEEKLLGIMEYRPSFTSEPVDLPHNSVPLRVSRPDGSYDAGVLAGVSTRYPWSLRNSVLNGRVDTWPITKRFDVLKAASRSSGVESKAYTPMMLKLWDPIGVVHELNGYRQDALGNVFRYRKEQELPLGAKEQIDEISTLLHNNAGVMADKFAATIKAGLEDELQKADDYVKSGMRPSEQVIFTETQQAFDEYKSGEIGWDDYIRRRESSISRNAGVRGATWGAPFSETRADEISRRYQAHDVLRQMNTADAQTNQSRAMLPYYQREAKEQWEKKYKPLIDWPAYQQRKAHYEDVLTAAGAYLEPRTRALKLWLSNPLFLAALEDYDGEDPKSGINFEVAITEAIAGLGADQVGRDYLEAQAKNLVVTDRDSLLWRVVALNQTDARQELAQYLKTAEENRSVLLDAAGKAWAVGVEAAKGLKNFLKYYKSYEELKKEIYPDSLISQGLKCAGVDRFIVGAGDFLMGALRFEKADKRVGEYMVQHVLSIRALMDEAESSNLITTEAAQLPAMRAYFGDRVRYYAGQPATRANANMLALADLEKHKGVDVMRERWRTLTASSASPIRLAGLTATLEAVNFINLSFKAEKRGEDYISLVASGISLLSVGITVSTNVSATIVSKDSLSYARVKFIGGGLGALSGAITTFSDAVSVAEAVRVGRVEMIIAFSAKTLIGLVTTTFQMLGSLAYAAPVIERVAGRTAITVWLTNARYGIETAAAARSARVMGTALSATAVRTGSVTFVSRAVVFLAGWEVAAALIAIQVTIWVISPNALEVWCERNFLGKIRQKNVFGLGGTESKYKNFAEQEGAFNAALLDVKIASSRD